ncbi:MAG: transcriptional regulator GcvA [Burkholderiales bacterium]|nr:MAG: transcriptional regulator GcvA [Burkholderiales bacterium]
MRNHPFRLPSPDLLVTFEAAARLLSFTRAAQERYVTQSAVSRQIRALEDDLGVALFRRRHRGLALTDDGRVLYEACRDAFERLRATVSQLRAPGERRVLTLTTTPGLAALWLIPRLSRFTQAHPDVDVRIDTSLDMRDLDADGIDVAIRYGRLDGMQGARMFEESVMPVCSPTLLAHGPPLAGPDDLRRHTLLRVVDPVLGVLPEWEPWLAAVGRHGLQPAGRLSFSRYDEVVSAAVLGHGVAIGRRPLIDSLLAEGRLVAPWSDELASPRGYFVVLSDAASRRPAAHALQAWLLDTATREGYASAPAG